MGRTSTGSYVPVSVIYLQPKGFSPQKKRKEVKAERVKANTSKNTKLSEETEETGISRRHRGNCSISEGPQLVTKGNISVWQEDTKAHTTVIKSDSFVFP